MTGGPAWRRTGGPVLIVHGGNDLQSLDVSESFAASFGGPADVRTIAQAGHFPHYTHPAEVVGIIARFLAEEHAN